jgi:hypothetical protein
MKGPETGDNYMRRSPLSFLTPKIIRMIKSRIRWTGHVARMGEMRNECKIYIGKFEGKVSLVRPRRR